MDNKDEILRLYSNVLQVIPNLYDPSAWLCTIECYKYNGSHLKSLLSKVGYDSTILDIGCAMGNLIRSIPYTRIKEIPLYKGVDINRDMLDIAKKQWVNCKNMIFDIYDISEMNLKHDYDVIVIYYPFAYFQTDEIIKMIDYYYEKTKKVLTFILLKDYKEYDKDLFIVNSDTDKIKQYISDTYPYHKMKDVDLTKVDHYVLVDIFKGRDYP